MAAWVTEHVAEDLRLDLSRLIAGFVAERVAIHQTRPLCAEEKVATWRRRIEKAIARIGSEHWKEH